MSAQKLSGDYLSIKDLEQTIQETLPVNIRIQQQVGKTRIFFYCVKKTLLMNYFQNYALKVPASSHFSEILGSYKCCSINQNGQCNLRKNEHFQQTSIQKKGSLPGFHIHTVCNLNFYYVSAICLLLGRWKNLAIAI